MVVGGVWGGEVEQTAPDLREHVRVALTFHCELMQDGDDGLFCGG